MKAMTAIRAQELTEMGGNIHGDAPAHFVTATEIRELADAWMLLDKIDAQIAAVIAPPKGTL